MYTYIYSTEESEISGIPIPLTSNFVFYLSKFFDSPEFSTFSTIFSLHFLAAHTDR